MTVVPRLCPILTIKNENLARLPCLVSLLHFRRRRHRHGLPVKDFKEISGEISPAVRNHVQTVYLFVLAALLAAVAGSYMHVHWYPSGWLTWYGILGGLGLIIGAPRRKEGEKTHILFLLAVALWEGFSVGPAIRMSICCYPMSILATLLMGAALIFGCFPGATLMSKRLENLLVGGLVSSAFSFLVWLHFASKIFGSSAVSFRVGVYVRVLIFLGYFILSSDFFAVLVPLIVIMVKMTLRSMGLISFGPKKSADPEENDDTKKIADPECADLKKSVDPEGESAGSKARAKGGIMELCLHVAMLSGCALVYLLFE